MEKAPSLQKGYGSTTTAPEETTNAQELHISFGLMRQGGYIWQWSNTAYCH